MKSNKNKKLIKQIDSRIRPIDYTCPYINNVQNSIQDCITLLEENVIPNTAIGIKTKKKIIKILAKECIGLTSYQNKNRGNTGLEKVREFNSALREDKLEAEIALRNITQTLQTFIDYKPMVKVKNSQK
jgi:hypothetical protein